MLGRDSVSAFVFDRQRDAALDRAGGQPQRAAARRVADGVGGQILQRLLPPTRSPVTCSAPGAIDVSCDGRQAGDRRGRSNSDRHAPAPRSAPRSSRAGEQLADAVRGGWFVADDRQVAAALHSSISSGIVASEGSAHRGDWRRQLVGHVGGS
jgi:hypothetical protein